MKQIIFRLFYITKVNFPAKSFEVRSLTPERVKLDPLSPTAPHCYGVFLKSKLCSPGDMPRKWTSSLVTRFECQEDFLSRFTKNILHSQNLPWNPSLHKHVRFVLSSFATHVALFIHGFSLQGFTVKQFAPWIS